MVDGWKPRWPVVVRCSSLRFYHSTVWLSSLTSLRNIMLVPTSDRSQLPLCIEFKQGPCFSLVSWDPLETHLRPTCSHFEQDINYFCHLLSQSSMFTEFLLCNLCQCFSMHHRRCTSTIDLIKSHGRKSRAEVALGMFVSPKDGSISMDSAHRLQLDRLKDHHSARVKSQESNGGKHMASG